MKVKIVDSRVRHIQLIVPNVRQADVVELWDYACVTPAQAMFRGLNQSRFARTGFINGEAACMFGLSIASISSGVGRPWMIGTKLLDQYAHAFLRRCKSEVDEMLDECRLLENYVDVRNLKAIAWLKWLGFEMGETEPMGLYQKPFIKFSKGAKDDHA